jgi:hypothetical protein
MKFQPHNIQCFMYALSPFVVKSFLFPSYILRFCYPKQEFLARCLLELEGFDDDALKEKLACVKREKKLFGNNKKIVLKLVVGGACTFV